MPREFLASCLYGFAAFFTVGAIGLAGRARKDPGPLRLALLAVLSLFLAAVLANAGADLWGAS